MTVFQLKDKLKTLLLLIISANELDYLTCDTNRLLVDPNKLNDCSDYIKNLYRVSGYCEIYNIYSKLLNRDLSSDAIDILTKYDVNLCNIYFEKYQKTLAQ